MSEPIESPERPTPSPSPEFDVGEPVWSTTSRRVMIVTAMDFRGSGPCSTDPRRRRFWGWVVKTVDPDDPTIRGEGYECCYQKMCREADG